MNEILANIIWLIHLVIVLFMLFAPFSKIPALLILHITSSISLLLHWYWNSDICSLSLLESNLRGLPYKETFMNSIIGPVYTIPYYEMTIFLMLVSLLNLLNDPKIQQMINSKKLDLQYLFNI